MAMLQSSAPPPPNASNGASRTFAGADTAGGVTFTDGGEGLCEGEGVTVVVPAGSVVVDPVTVEVLAKAGISMSELDKLIERCFWQEGGVLGVGSADELYQLTANLVTALAMDDGQIDIQGEIAMLDLGEVRQWGKSDFQNWLSSRILNYKVNTPTGRPGIGKLNLAALREGGGGGGGADLTPRTMKGRLSAKEVAVLIDEHWAKLGGEEGRGVNTNEILLQLVMNLCVSLNLDSSVSDIEHSLEDIALLKSPGGTSDVYVDKEEFKTWFVNKFFVKDAMVLASLEAGMGDGEEDMLNWIKNIEGSAEDGMELESLEGVHRSRSSSVERYAGTGVPLSPSHRAPLPHEIGPDGLVVDREEHERAVLARAGLSSADFDGLIGRYFGGGESDGAERELMVSSEEDIMNLTTNLCVSLIIDLDMMEIQKKVRSLDVSQVRNWSKEDFKAWFSDNILAEQKTPTGGFVIDPDSVQPTAPGEEATTVTKAVDTMLGVSCAIDAFFSTLGDAMSLSSEEELTQLAENFSATLGMGLATELIQGRGLTSLPPVLLTLCVWQGM